MKGCKVKCVYKFPLCEISIKVGPPLYCRVGLAPYSKVDCLSIKTEAGEKQGVFVYYNEDRPAIDILESRKRGKRATECLVAASDIIEAIRIFRKEWEGAMVGGNREELKALWIRRDKPIIKFPSCDLLHILRQGNGSEQFICGEPKEEGAMLCVLEGWDGFDECPIEIFYQKLFDLKEKKKVPVKMFRRYKVIAGDDVMKQG